VTATELNLRPLEIVGRTSIAGIGFSDVGANNIVMAHKAKNGDYFCIADTSGIRLRPNRSQEAIELYDRGELSGPALRRETGFQPEDAPADEQLQKWLLREIATGSTSPEQTIAALAQLGIDLGSPAAGVNREPPDDLRTDTIPQLVQRNIPTEEAARERADRDARNRAGISAACNVLVFRALERAGNRLRNAHPRTDTSALSAAAVYRTLSGDPDKLLEGAWECASEVLAPYADQVEIAAVVDTLDFYVRGLLASHHPHSDVVLTALMDTRPKPLVAVL